MEDRALIKQKGNKGQAACFDAEDGFRFSRVVRIARTVNNIRTGGIDARSPGNRINGMGNIARHISCPASSASQRSLCNGRQFPPGARSEDGESDTQLHPKSILITA